MGYRYTDNEIERLTMDDNYTRALKAARAARVHIEPSRDDYEAIEFLANVYITAEEVSELDVDYYDRSEYVENDVPYNNYKCGMIFAQLGLWYDRMQTTLDQDYIDGIRYILYDTALDAVNELVEGDDL
jgi:hypothetical protein